MDSKDTASEQYALDPADFYLEKVDDSLHDNLCPVNYEWWYFDATFENNYSMASLWQEQTKAGKDGGIVKERFIDFSVYDPDGKKIMLKKPFDNKLVSISTETCDVKMGGNRVFGEPPTYKMHFLEDGLGADLEFKSLVQGYRSPPDGTAYFSMNPLIYMGWAIAQPRATVKGKLIVDGKEMNVVGAGYHDHNWGNSRFDVLYDYWYWGRIFLPGHTFIYSLSQLGECMDHTPLNFAVTFEGEKLVDMSQELIGEPSDFVLDEETGIEYPRKLVLKMNTDVVKGEITHNLKHLIESYPLAVGYPMGDNSIMSRGHGAVRFFSDCIVDITVKGKRVKYNTSLIHEFIKP
ncbi:MAG: hypothetical protein NTZ34_14010 [Chloroflexi bacterium]|nr:hypothetical protein [Chloroflexota bacterium]